MKESANLKLVKEFVSRGLQRVQPGMDLPALLFGFTGKHELRVVPIPGPFFASQATKDQLFLRVLPKLVQDERLVECHLVVTAWTIPPEYLPKPEDGEVFKSDDLPIPSEHPNRIEVVAVTSMMEKGNTTIGYLERDEDDCPVLTRWEPYSEQQEMVEGRVMAVVEAVQTVRAEEGVA